MKSHPFQSQRGASLLFVVLILVVIGMVIAALVSIMNTESFTAMNQSAAVQAFGVAEGGVEFEERNLAQDLAWYRSTSDPMPVSTRTLGSSPNSGSFTVSSNLPATRLRKKINSGPTATICVSTTDRFTPPTTGYLQIGKPGQDPYEFVQYTGVASPANCPAQFTGVTRATMINGVSGGVATTVHDRDEWVYPVTALVDALANNCSSLTSLRITDHPKFLTAGTLSVLTNTTPGSIKWEEISYSNSKRSAGVMTLLGVKRCREGFYTPGSPPPGQAVGNPITPILADGTPPDDQAEVVSTGTVAVTIIGNAVRVLRKTVQR
jgi:hypothetical protein